MRAGMVAIMLAMLVGCGSGGGGEVKSDVIVDRVDREPLSGPITSPRDATFGKLLNSYRLASGAGSVQFDSRLNAAAQKHAQDMVDQNYFAHRGRDGRTVGDRVRAEGYDFRFVGEALGARQQTEAQVMTDWQNSPTHDAVLTDRRAEDFGLGVAGSGTSTKWALVVGAEK
ncbi:Cysteine-rich secretory protein family protein [Loktanella sp. DSM 29012]|uniref:CAP domain-containing protein n=2 Tax=Loktanella TaxID=245186 RepID=A0ABS8BVA6_9RHOB|nr:CAP domain-containing protein [Loktanella gaetbuli]MCB5199673.1 CAP domain-containing protein [Loktanella gaetbuli]SEQ00902.1 Cysteine-rich secretory protein family protein [Loktanella sp. DSM 29012]